MRIGVKMALALALGVVCTGLYAATHLRSSSPGPRAAGGAGASPPAVPVQTAVAEARDVPIIVRGLGTVTAYNTVTVRSRVQGNITQVNFREGQEVKQGELLVQIDPRPYQAILDQADATLLKDQANLDNARKDLTRYGDLLKRNYTPEQQYATQEATVAQDEATVKNDEAQIEAARLNVDYASIRSPIDGVTGIRQVDLGNLIQANDTQPLVVITQIKPIYVVFTAPEKDIARIRDVMAHGELKTLAFDAADQNQIAEGTLRLVDNQVDQTTGTVKLKAEFANADGKLWPGQFVNAHLVVQDVRNGVTAPAAAVQTGPNGSFVYTVKPDSTVEQRDVVISQTENNLVLVQSGLQVGERVVTGGQFRLKAGTKVAVTHGGPTVAAR